MLQKAFFRSLLEAMLSKISARTPTACGCLRGTETPGFASLNPGLISRQPFGLRFARRRRVRKLARGGRAKRATPGFCSI